MTLGMWVAICWTLLWPVWILGILIWAYLIADYVQHPVQQVRRKTHDI